MVLTLNDRKVIAKRWADGDSAVSIAKGLGCAPGTIYALHQFASGSADGALDLHAALRHLLQPPGRVAPLRADTGPHRGA